MATTRAATMTVRITMGMVMMTARMETAIQAMPSPIMTSHIKPALFQFSRTIAKPRRRDSPTLASSRTADPPEEGAQQVEKDAPDEDDRASKEDQTKDAHEACRGEVSGAI